MDDEIKTVEKNKLRKRVFFLPNKYVVRQLGYDLGEPRFSQKHPHYYFMEAITVEVAVSALSYVMCFEMHELKKRRLKYIYLRLFRYLTTSLTFSSF